LSDDGVPARLIRADLRAGRDREGVPRCLKDLIEGCHRPYVLAGAVEDIQAIHNETLGLLEEAESFAEECEICASGKMVTLSKQIQELVPNNHRVLILNQSRRMLDMIQPILSYRGCR
jgi:SNF2 family DNA or RNA helicase